MKTSFRSCSLLIVVARPRVATISCITLTTIHLRRRRDCGRQPGDNFIELFWNDSRDPDVEGYNVYVSNTYGGRYEYVASRVHPRTIGTMRRAMASCITMRYLPTTMKAMKVI